MQYLHPVEDADLLTRDTGIEPVFATHLETRGPVDLVRDVRQRAFVLLTAPQQALTECRVVHMLPVGADACGDRHRLLEVGDEHADGHFADLSWSGRQIPQTVVELVVEGFPGVTKKAHFHFAR
ncbi:hypothetical protein [Streptomyces sp. MN6]